MSRFGNMIMIDKFYCRFPRRILSQNRQISHLRYRHALGYFSTKIELYKDNGDEYVRTAIANTLRIVNTKILASRFWQTEVKRDIVSNSKHGYRLVVRDKNVIFKELQRRKHGDHQKLFQWEKGGTLLNCIQLSRMPAWRIRLVSKYTIVPLIKAQDIDGGLYEVNSIVSIRSFNMQKYK